MRRVPGHALSWLVVTGALLVAFPAAAQDAIERMSGQLLSSDDFRVRTQAALALGASKSKRAINPLCKGLDDSNTTVRAAAAAALGKLKLGGAPCLERRQASEKNAAVLASIKKAIGLVKVTPSAPVLSSSTKYYLAIGKVSDKTGRNGKELEGMVRGAMSQTASSIEGYAVAPEDESAAQAKQKLGKFKNVKAAFYLLPKLNPPSYTNGDLMVKVEVTVFSYPAKAMKGSFSVKLTQQDVGDKDTGAETELIVSTAQRAVEKFAADYAQRFE